MFKFIRLTVHRHGFVLNENGIELEIGCLLPILIKREMVQACLPGNMAILHISFVWWMGMRMSVGPITDHSQPGIICHTIHPGTHSIATQGPT